MNPKCECGKDLDSTNNRGGYIMAEYVGGELYYARCFHNVVIVDKKNGIDLRIKTEVL